MNRTIVALDLRGTQFSDFPLEILNHSQLQILILDGEYEKANYFVSLPSEINKLQELKYLNLRFCQLVKLPIQLNELTNLQTLDLRFNRISEIKGLAQLTNLTTLYLRSNEILETDQVKLKKVLPNCEIYF